MGSSVASNAEDGGRGMMTGMTDMLGMLSLEDSNSGLANRLKSLQNK